MSSRLPPARPAHCMERKGATKRQLVLVAWEWGCLLYIARPAPNIGSRHCQARPAGSACPTCLLRQFGRHSQGGHVLQGLVLRVGEAGMAGRTALFRYSAVHGMSYGSSGGVAWLAARVVLDLRQGMAGHGAAANMCRCGKDADSARFKHSAWAVGGVPLKCRAPSAAGPHATAPGGRLHSWWVRLGAAELRHAMPWRTMPCPCLMPCHAMPCPCPCPYHATPAPALLPNGTRTCQPLHSVPVVRHKHGGDGALLYKGRRPQCVQMTPDEQAHYRMLMVRSLPAGWRAQAPQLLPPQ